MVFAKKIKAGALQYVLVISVIIAIIIVAFISLIFLQQRLSLKHSFTKEAIHNTQMSFEYLKHKEIPYNTETTLTLSENELENTTILKKHWGIFDVAIANSKVKNEFFQKVGILGTQNKKKDALYLKDNNQSLVLVGNTKITGNVSLPKQGVKSGNIAGTSYYGNQLIYGSKKTSLGTFPKIKNSKYVNDLYKNYRTDTTQNFELEFALNIHQSFTENTLLYEDSNSIVLENISLNGNIVIVSKTSIQVKASSKLQDVILIAPKITIEKNTQGNFQAIASKTIGVQENCNLMYPTALIVLEKETQQQILNQQNKLDYTINVAKNARVKGMLVYYSESNTSNFNAQIKIDERAIITGEVYCSKNLELQGIINGSVITNNFIIKKSGSTYLNHIYNGVINATKLPNQYAGLQINQVSNQVAKWVD